MMAHFENTGEKATVLILGGCGFVGRNLVEYLITNELVSAIRIVDKIPPQVAWLNAKHKEFLNHNIVEFRSANLRNTESCEKAFLLNEHCTKWDYVINCAGETKCGQTDPVYEEGILTLSLNCAKEAEKYNVKHYVEISSGHMYSPAKTPHKEDGPLEPWTFVAKWKAQVENEFKNFNTLRYTILRPAIIYGVGDRHGLTTRLIIAAVYKYLEETMKLLWNSDLKLNTIYIEDLCRAIWFVCERDDTIKETYNVVDDGNTTQGIITDMVCELFNINHDYWGNTLSKIVKTDMISLMEEVNDKHLSPWAEACQADGIINTPLSPYMSEELLYNKNLLLDGTKLKNKGFTLRVPHVTKENLVKIIRDFVEMKVYPNSLAP